MIHIPCDSIRFQLLYLISITSIWLCKLCFLILITYRVMLTTCNPKPSIWKFNSNKDRRIHSRLVHHRVWEPDKDGSPYVEILKEWLKDSIFTRQHKMAHKLLSSLLVNQKHTF